METYKTENYKGMTIRVVPDKDPMSPDEWENDDVFLVYDHGQFCVRRKGFDPETIFAEIQEDKRKTPVYDGYDVFPVYAYIHSGVILSLGRTSYPFTCPWDTSYRGFALVSKKEFTRQKAYNAAQAIVNEWNQYLSGEVYGWIVEDSAGEHIDSCWGYYGEESIPDMIQEAKGAIDSYIRERAKSHAEKVKAWIKNHVPLTHRQPLTYV